MKAAPTAVFKPEARGTLPLRAENLEVLQEALVSVVQNPRGTANFRLRGMDLPAAGKTGTAESGSASGKPHAWFAGYTDCAERAEEYPVCGDKPDIAVAVIVENIGDGSEYGGPIFRRMIQVHYFGTPQSLFLVGGQLRCSPNAHPDWRHPNQDAETVVAL